MQKRPLTGTAWTLTAVGDLSHVPGPLRQTLLDGVPATVPGCVHTDLLAHGLLEDPYLGDNEARQHWIGRTGWRYASRFVVDDALLHHDRLDLACDGLDTIATIELNGHRVAFTENMHVGYRFDIKRFAHAGPNVLTIEFAAPVNYIEAQEKEHGRLPYTGFGSNTPRPHNQARKMACNFGWDWGPDVATCGIWRPIALEAWDTARIASVRPLVMEASESRARVEVHVAVEPSGSPLPPGEGLGVRAATASPRGDRPTTHQPPSPQPPGAPGGRGSLKATVVGPAGETFDAKLTGDTLHIDVPNPKRWWPIGHGEQPLYELTVSLLDADGERLDTWTRRIGLRTTALVVAPDPTPVGDPIPDKQGAGMTIHVNGKPIYCKGADWIPDDCFPHRVTAERYRQRILQARLANMNMLRVWGGGLYETREFYDACDELGIMVWQDFCFACACYREEEPYRSLVEEEARYNVTRLSPHPSLVIWNGCNENIWGTFDWAQDWQDLRTKNTCTWGLGYYLELFPRIVAELDPTRPYWAASPYSGSMDLHPNLNEYGNRHIWDVWHGPGQYRNYLAHYPRLATEFGFHGPPTWPTLARAVPPDQRQWDSPVMRRHNKNSSDKDGQLQSNLRMADDFVPPTDCDRPGTPGNFDDWLYLAQIMQARALALGVEWFRALYPWNSGALYWQLNDCWPVASWSAIDGDGRLKPLWYASRRFFADRLVTIKPKRAPAGHDAPGPLCVYLHNDHDEPWAGELLLRQCTLDGAVVAEHRAPVQVAPRGLTKLDAPAAMSEAAAGPDTFLVADVAPPTAGGSGGAGISGGREFRGSRGFWWSSPDKVMAYPEPRFDATLDSHGSAHRLTLVAKTLLRDLCVFADRLDPDATVSDQFITLLPGDRVTLEIRSDMRMTLEELTRPPVLNCANRFGAAAITTAR